MPTVLVDITGDISDIVNNDFLRAQVRLRANTDFVSDPDADKIRVFEYGFHEVAANGEFVFANVIASVDTVLPGTLQYYLDVRCRQQYDWLTVTLGPYVLTVDADVSDLEATQPTGVVRLVTGPLDGDVLSAANAYTDDSMDAHIAAYNPHRQYARLEDAAGTPTGGRIIVVGAGGQFPPVELGAILVYGGI